MAYTVDFNTVSTVGLESSPFAAALAGLRANEARYFKEVEAEEEAEPGLEVFEPEGSAGGDEASRVEVPTPKCVPSLPDDERALSEDEAAFSDGERAFSDAEAALFLREESLSDAGAAV